MFRLIIGKTPLAILVSKIFHKSRRFLIAEPGEIDLKEKTKNLPDFFFLNILG